MTGYSHYLKRARKRWGPAVDTWPCPIWEGAVTDWILHDLAVAYSRKRHDVTRKFEKYEGSTCVTYVNQLCTTWSVMMEETVACGGGARKYKYKDAWVEEHGDKLLGNLPVSRTLRPPPPPLVFFLLSLVAGFET